MAAMMRAKEWTETPLGPAQNWPQSLKTTVRLMLTSQFAMWLGWGPELTFLCNDAYRQDTLGIKGTWAVGARSDQVWAEIWPEIGPRIESVLATGDAFWAETLPLFLERSGFPEETYHTFSYQAVSDDHGVLAGMLCVVIEETERVISERRLTLLREFSSELASANLESEVLSVAGASFDKLGKDVPFSLVYLFDAEDRTLRLASASGVTPGSEIAPLRLESDAKTPWPIDQTRNQPVPVRVTELKDRFTDIPTGPWEIPATQALIVSIARPGQGEPAGFLVAGINPYRQLDDDYIGFLELLARQIAAGISNARAYESERRRADELAKLDLAKTAFFSNVSHELRTPLTLMLGPVEDSLGEDSGSEELTPKLRANLTVAHRNGLRLLKLVNNLLDFSRIEAGRVQARYQPTDLSAYTAELASSFQSATQRAGLTLNVRAKPLAAPVYLDLDMWEKIILNLLSNALKHTFEGSIEVVVDETDSHAFIEVRDSGIGIPDEERSRIFERFHRVEGARGRTHEGTGIGLALVHELVRLHGGAVTVASHVGKGSTFTVTVPFGRSHLPADRLIAASEPYSPGGASSFIEEAMRWLPEQTELSVGEEGLGEGVKAGARLLIADDNLDMREYLQRLLAPHYRVEAVADGVEALNALRRSRADLVLTDVMMPRLDGFGLVNAIREDSALADVPVIVLSARAGEEAKVEGLEKGIDDYMVKPFSGRELLARVRSNLELSRLRGEAREREITLRKEAEAAHSRLDFVIRKIHDLFAVLDSEWRITYVSDSVAVYAGISREDLLGRSVWELFPDVADTPVEANLREVMDERTSRRFEWQTAASERWLDVRVDPAPEGGVAILAVDITNHMRVERELEERVERRTAELKEANREMEGFTYTVSHDLRTPLRSIVFNSSLLLEDLGETLDPDHRELLIRQKEAARKLATLIDDLLKLSRLSRQEMVASQVDLSAVATEIAAQISAVNSRSAEFVVQPGMTAVADGHLVRFVLSNLMENAFKFSPDGGAILIGSQEVENETVFFVADHGIGFDPAYAHRMFQPFERLVTEQEFPGTGIGLANAERIVERHQGRIWAESKLGEGATFFFTLGPKPLG